MIDLHIHTTYSDGTNSVKEILDIASSLKLSTISITDHDTCEAYNEINKQKNNYNCEIINGCEITTTYKGEIIEVLAYNFDINQLNELLIKKLIPFKERKILEYELIAAKLTELDVKFDINNIKYDPNKYSSRRSFYDEIIKYKENKQFFISEEAWQNFNRFARDELFNPKSRLYINQSSLFPDLKEVIDIIHQSNGLAFLAHPFTYALDIKKEMDSIINDYAFDGIECFYTTFTDEESSFLVNYCKHNNLLISGGSDYHGANKTNHNLGIGNGNLNISNDILNDWK